MRRSTAVLAAAVIVLGGAGVASARIVGGAPWSYEPVDAEAMLADPTFDPNVLTTHVTDVFDGMQLDEGCAAAALGGNDFQGGSVEDAEQLNVILAYDALATALESGQTSHMVHSTRVLLDKCDGSNEGLQNALAVHMRNWMKHYEHEMWLREKFAEKWPDGKPGGNPHVAEETGDTETSTDTKVKVHGNPHAETGQASHGNANGHDK
jgi:hypothetical protein